LVRLYGLDECKIDVVHLGVGGEFRPEREENELLRVRARYGLPERFFLYLGALEPRKNLEALIDAVALLRRTGTGEALVIAGSGSDSYESSLMAHARSSGLILGRELYFTGHVEDRDLAALYSASTLFVFPSRYEGFGLPPLEAMACGTPVVTTDAASLPEVVGDAAFTVDPDDERDMAGAIIALLVQDNLAAELKQKGLLQAARFSWEKTATETLLVYDRVSGA